MAVNDNDFITFRSFLGINNQSKETAVAANVLRDAVNINLDRDGKIRSRDGYSAPVVACENGHSLWTAKFLPFALFADEADLRVFWPNEQADTVFSGLSPGLPVSYTKINDAVFWSNGQQRGMVGLDLDATDWACEQPAGQPALAALANGGFKPGKVQVCVTFIDSRGRESGATVAAEITLAAAGGVEITNLPQPLSPDTQQIRIYATGPDGKALCAAATLPAGTPQYLLLNPPGGRLIATQFLRPMPAGQLLASGNARQFVARENVLFWSPALRYGMCLINQGYTRFPATIDLLAFTGDGTDGAGLYVACGDRTYWLAGPEPAQWRQVIASSAGAVPGSMCMTPAKVWGIDSRTEVPAWLANDGHFVVGLPGGSVVSYHEDEAVTAIGERGASLFRNADGLRQFLTTLRAPTRLRSGIGDSVVDKVYRYDGPR